MSEIKTSLAFKFTSEPGISSYLDPKTGQEKYRVFITFKFISGDFKNLLSKDYSTTNDARKFGSILRFMLEVKGEGFFHLTTSNLPWDNIKRLTGLHLSEFVRNLHRERLVLFSSCASIPCRTDDHVNLTTVKGNSFVEETYRDSDWWDANWIAFHINLGTALTIASSLLEYAEFEHIHPKMFENFVRNQKKSFFVEMINYVNPSTCESYFSFKTDLMKGIFSESDILLCFNQFKLSFSDDLDINGSYYCDRIHNIIVNC